MDAQFAYPGGQYGSSLPPQAAHAETNLIQAYSLIKRAETVLQSAQRFNSYSKVDGWFNFFSGDPTGGDFGGIQVHRQKQAHKYIQQAAQYLQAAQAAMPMLPPVRLPVIEWEGRTRMILLNTSGVNQRNLAKVQAAMQGIAQLLMDIDRNIQLLRQGGINVGMPQPNNWGVQAPMPMHGAYPAAPY